MKLTTLTALRSLTFVVFAMVLTLPAFLAQAGQQQDIVDGFAGVALAQDKAFAGFSIERGRDLFSSRPGTGKPDTPSCTSCHSENPENFGQTRAGKGIDPMAISKSPGRYTELEKVEKWFRRNCNSVLGRACSPLEKGDFLTFMMTR